MPIVGQVDTFLRSILVCPICRGKLAFHPGSARCGACELLFPQTEAGYFEFLPSGLLDADWAERQQEMEVWYQDLISTPARAGEWLAYDYTPYATHLATFSGKVLDIGGGAGIAQHYLPPETQYVVLDPSLDWLRVEWREMERYFPRLAQRPCFVRGVGEQLPFPAETFDAVFAFWSLNHADDPAQVFQEAHRVLRPEGRFLIVLEDMEPNWSDLLKPNFLSQGRRRAVKTLGAKLWLALSGRQWPLQSDHVRICEDDLQRWQARSFRTLKRYWVSQFLTYELQRWE